MLKALLGEKCEKNAHFFERGGALIAVRTPKQICSDSRFKIALAHTDFPTLKITPNPDYMAAGVRTLHPEIYGSPLFTSWLDRDLSYAGLLAYEMDGKVQSKLIRGDKLFRIPQLAVHLNRGVNQDGLKVNPQNDLNALWTAVGGKEKFVEALQLELPAGANLLDFDVQLFDAQPAQFGGFENEWIFSGRLDNLSSCHAIAEAFAEADSLEKDFQVAAFFNNEEVGSETREGAGSNFLKSVLESSLREVAGTSDLDAMLAASLALSIDMAHAEHPNFVQKHEPNHAPILGEGVVLKINSQKRYASDVFSNAQFKLICKQNNIPYQTFVIRNDMPCGSTVGPTISASLGIPTVDIGEPMLSMHSIREMTDVRDHEKMTLLLRAFWK
jgi:aspartyl aminopeptidase